MVVAGLQDDLQTFYVKFPKSRENGGRQVKYKSRTGLTLVAENRVGKRESSTAQHNS